MTLLAIAVTGCGEPQAIREHARYVEACESAESAGALDAAVEACTRAFTLEAGTPALEGTGGLTAFRLARLERQRSRFASAAEWLRVAEAKGLEDGLQLELEWALVLAGEGQWEAGAERLLAAAPAALALEGSARDDARNIFHGYATWLRRLEQDTTAQRLTEVAGQLAGPTVVSHE